MEGPAAMDDHGFVEEEDYVTNWTHSGMLASNASMPVLEDEAWRWTDPALMVEAAVLSLVVVLTVLGNLLVILAVWHTPALRTPTHMLIVNLATADFLLGATVLPLSAAKELYQGKWIFGPLVCSMWTTLDVLCCTASILSLCAISVDRYVGVSRPLSYSRIISKRKVYCLIAGIWVLSLAISIAPPLGWKDELMLPWECHVNKQLSYVIFSACGSFYLPALVIVVLYSLVYRAAARHSRLLYSGSRVTRSEVTLRVHVGNSRPRASLHTITYSGDIIQKTDQYNYSMSPMAMGPGSTPHTPNGTIDRKSMLQRGSDASRTLIPGLDGRVVKFQREKKAAKSLAIVVGGFFLCWLPFFIILPLDAACTSCELSGLPFTLAFWLGYFNSCLNPFIYACSSRELRRAFVRLVCPFRRNYLRHRHSNVNLTYTSTTSLKRV